VLWRESGSDSHSLERLQFSPQRTSIKGNAVAHALKHFGQGVVQGRIALVSAPSVMLHKTCRVFLLSQKRFVLLPRHNQLAGLQVVNQSRIGIDPLRPPLVSSDVLEDAHALERDTRGALFPECVLQARYNRLSTQ
jgi:hypothetical protein